MTEPSSLHFSTLVSLFLYLGAKTPENEFIVLNLLAVGLNPLLLAAKFDDTFSYGTLCYTEQLVKDSLAFPALWKILILDWFLSLLAS